mgnify:CR=1 FL=1
MAGEEVPDEVVGHDIGGAGPDELDHGFDSRPRVAAALDRVDGAQTHTVQLEAELAGAVGARADRGRSSHGDRSWYGSSPLDLPAGAAVMGKKRKKQKRKVLPTTLAPSGTVSTKRYSRRLRLSSQKFIGPMTTANSETNTRNEMTGARPTPGTNSFQ